MSSEAGRPSHEPQNVSKSLKDGNRGPNTLRKAPPAADDLRSRASTTNSDPAIKRHGDTLPMTKSVKEVDPRKTEQNPPAKRPRESRTPPSSASDVHETEISVNPQPSTADSSPKKVGHESMAEPGVQRVHGTSNRSTGTSQMIQIPQLSAPPGITATILSHPSLRPEVVQTQTPLQAAAGVTAVSLPAGAERADVDKKSDEVEGLISAAISNDQRPNGLEGPGEINEEDMVIILSDEMGTKQSPEVEQDDEDDTDPEIQSNTQDGASMGMLGGIASALGMRPAMSKEARLERENKMLRKDCYNIDMAYRRLRHDAVRLHHDNERLRETLEAMSLEIKAITKRYEESKTLSETRGKELLGAQVFLSKADALSMSELVQKVDGLNDEIYQAAASLGEAIVQKKHEPSDQPHPSPEESPAVKNLLGSALCKILRSQADQELNPLLVQITLQTFFVGFCVQRIRSWAPSSPPFHLALQGLYDKIWASTDQAVSGRWRALTRAQLKPDTNEWSKELLSGLDAVLATASWELGSPEDKRTLETRLPAIFKVVAGVREAIGEKFTSADVQVAFLEPNSPFDERYMEEAYEADSEGPKDVRKIVVATVGMGLRKLILHQGLRALEYVLHPKVVLESALNAVLEPPPPRPSRSKSTRR